jgi:hypothetical protein
MESAITLSEKLVIMLLRPLPFIATNLVMAQGLALGVSPRPEFGREYMRVSDCLRDGKWPFYHPTT